MTDSVIMNSSTWNHCLKIMLIANSSSILTACTHKRSSEVLDARLDEPTGPISTPSQPKPVHLATTHYTVDPLFVESISDDPVQLI